MNSWVFVILNPAHDQLKLNDEACLHDVFAGESKDSLIRNERNISRLHTLKNNLEIIILTPHL